MDLLVRNACVVLCCTRTYMYILEIHFVHTNKLFIQKPVLGYLESKSQTLVFSTIRISINITNVLYCTIINIKVNCAQFA